MLDSIREVLGGPSSTDVIVLAKILSQCYTCIPCQQAWRAAHISAPLPSSTAAILGCCPRLAIPLMLLCLACPVYTTTGKSVERQRDFLSHSVCMQGQGREAAKTYLENLTAKQRYQRDVWF